MEKLLILYINAYQVNKFPLGFAPQTKPRGIYVMPRFRHISAAAHYRRRAPLEAIFGDAIPEQRGLSISLPFSRADGGLHDGQSTRTNSMNRSGAYHFRTTCLQLHMTRFARLSNANGPSRSQPAPPPFKISLVHRQRDYPKAYVLTADSFVSYALISAAIRVHMYLKVRSRRRTRTRTYPAFFFSGLCAPSAQVRPVICW